MTYRGRLSVAPMLDWTTRHCRVFHRALSKEALLYTEMATIQAIKHSKKDQLAFNSEYEGDVILQVGGSDIELLRQACQKANQYAYAGINFNLGCPSPKVQKGAFGACLMLEPKLVTQLTSVMVKESKHPVSVKLRIGVDQQEGYPELSSLVRSIADTGVKELIVHARKALLSGLSPKENREIPPLQYDLVYQLKQEFPELLISINGGIKDIASMKKHLELVDGVMVGREAWHNPNILRYVDSEIYSNDGLIGSSIIAMKDALFNIFPYWKDELEKGTKLNYLLMPIFGATHGMVGAAIWRQELTHLMHDKQLNYLEALNRLEELINKLFID